MVKRCGDHFTWSGKLLEAAQYDQQNNYASDVDEQMNEEQNNDEQMNDLVEEKKLEYWCDTAKVVNFFKPYILLKMR